MPYYIAFDMSSRAPLLKILMKESSAYFNYARALAFLCHTERERI